MNVTLEHRLRGVGEEEWVVGLVISRLVFYIPLMFDYNKDCLLQLETQVGLLLFII